MASGYAPRNLRAAAWTAALKLRDNLVARTLLGVGLFLRALARRAQARNLDCISDLCTIKRVVRIRAFTALAGAIEARVLDRTCRQQGRQLPSASNGLREDFLQSRSAGRIVEAAKAHDLDWIVHLGGDLILLKAPAPAGGEQGVVLVKYSSAFYRLAALYDLPALLQSYKIVLEPSGIDYQAPELYLFLDDRSHVLVQAHQPSDYDYIKNLRTNLTAVPTGSTYWVDDDVFRPLPGIDKKYRAIMIAAWTPLKRHAVLLRALADLDDSSARVALVGYSWDGFDRRWIDEAVARHGLQRQVDIFENLQPSQVNEVLNQSVSNLLLSEKEGGNKAVYEGMFAGVPCIVSAQHRGIRITDVNRETGLLVKDEDLASALRRMAREASGFKPREWAIENASYRRSTKILEAALIESARSEGRPWTYGILPKVNRPNLRYKDPVDEKSMRPHYPALARYLRPAATKA